MWVYENFIYINVIGIVVGLKEVDGLLGEIFDIIYKDLYCEEDNWELVERRLMMEFIDFCL